MKILLIDDQINVVQSLKDAIEPAGHECYSCQDPVLALEKFRNDSYDVVITDYKMPGMNGLELLTLIQQEKPGTPVIMFTGYAEVENVIEATNMGVFAFYRKPINIRELLKTLDKLQSSIKLKKQKETEFNRLKNQNKLYFMEIQHRVRNNLQLISSLINLQINFADDKKNKIFLKEHENRIKTIGLAYEKLNESINFITIDFTEYIHNLIRYLKVSYSSKFNNIDIKVDTDNIWTAIDYTIPIGLVVNEIISNSLKYAFPESFKENPEIVVWVQDMNHGICLTISDNGIGFPKEIDLFKSNTLGLKLIKTLVENQLGGSIKLEKENGTKYTIILKLADEFEMIHYKDSGENNSEY
ncbi:response regulator [candidate division KSB1 bacterium]|nr:response regulator [candidate division KSB1 bacterium]